MDPLDILKRLQTDARIYHGQPNTERYLYQQFIAELPYIIQALEEEKYDREPDDPRRLRQA